MARALHQPPTRHPETECPAHPLGDSGTRLLQGRNQVTARRTAWGAYAQITDALRQRITDGTYAPGSQLPAEVALCAEFRVVRNTVRRALSTLQAEGLISVRTGIGRFVNTPTNHPPPGTRPQYARIAEHLRHQISNGTIPPGARLPSEARICERYGVSRFTARQALRSLEDAGLVTCVQGVGRHVRQDVPR
ncbi:winged helix-turn-helix domain-containing protein [Actinomadura viridis]|uniref:GntR family transcriptional regulator n=1 Tax=Actinomadura viridis TaxID=58110 RepID=UPI0027DC0A67|nr:winged helix-turn-helix domain-containing protein [Actinomadura viridis]